MIGHEQGGFLARRADTLQAKAEHAHQAALPPADNALVESLSAGETQAGEWRQQTQQGDRQTDQQMHDQKRYAQQIAQWAQGVAGRWVGRVGGIHRPGILAH